MGESDCKRQLFESARKNDAVAVLRCIADKDPDLVDVNSAFRLAVKYNSLKVVQELLALSICVNNSCERSRLTPLVLAISAGNTKMCELLLDAEADANVVAPNGESAFNLSSRSGLVEI